MARSYRTTNAVGARHACDIFLGVLGDLGEKFFFVFFVLINLLMSHNLYFK